MRRCDTQKPPAFLREGRAGGRVAPLKTAVAPGGACVKGAYLFDR